MSAHTPGEWAYFSNQFAIGITEVKKGGHDIAEMSEDTSKSKGEKEANARLISAAPDLLSVLVKLRDYHVNHHVLHEIDAAIAKATGA